VSYLLDTNVLSEWRKSRPDPGIADWFSRVHLDDLYLSVITVAEIHRGIVALRQRNDHRQARLYEAWLETTKKTFGDRLVPIGVDVAEMWGQLDLSRPISVTDGLIAATALVRNWPVVTRNVKDFERAGVRVVNPFTG
jgi:toxin FitB